MNTRSFLSLLILSTLTSCVNTKEPVVDPTTYATLFDANATPTAPLRELFAVIKIPCSATLGEINKTAQANLLRKGERWEIEQKWESERERIMPLLRTLGFLDAQLPATFTSQTPAYAFIFVLGGLQSRIEKRIAQLATLAQTYPALLAPNKAGKRPTIVLLTGERPLDPKQESLAQEQLQTEADMMRVLMQRSPLGTYPNIELISAPMKTDAKGNKVRPTTDDTVIAFKASHPTPELGLIITDQPFGLRQLLVLKSLLPGWTLHTATAAATENLPVAVFLDELARTIYQIAKIEGKA